jgi:hypothetical protein
MVVIGEDGLLVLLQRVVQLQVKEHARDQELGLELGLAEPDLVLVLHVRHKKLKYVLIIVM